MMQALADGEFDVVVTFAEGGNSTLFEDSGFSRPEPTGRWTMGPVSSLRLPRCVTPGFAYRLRCTFLPCVIAGIVAEQRLVLGVNDHVLCDQGFREWTTLDLDIPASALANRRDLTVVFRHPDAAAPSEVNGQGDSRRLALFITELAVSRGAFVGDPPGAAPTTQASSPAIVGAERIRLVFTDDAIVAEGVPANFKGAIDTLQVSPLVKYAEFSRMRSWFTHCRLADLGDKPGFLPLGLFGHPTGWTSNGRLGLGETTPRPRQLLDAHPGLKLLIDYSWEFGMGGGFWADMDAFVAALDVDPARVVVLVGNSGAETRYRRHLEANGRPAADCYAVIGMEFFLAYSATEFSRRNWPGLGDSLIAEAEVEAMRHRHRPYKYLSLNRRPRWHRFMLALMLVRSGLRASGLVSMPSTAYTGDWTSEAGWLDHYGGMLTPSFWAELKAIQDAAFATLPWIIDRDMDNSGHTSHYAYDIQERRPYLDAYFQIVTESYCEGDDADIVISEKTAKALIGQQPFIVFSTPKLFARLESLGFARPDHFDTDYDAIAGLGPRLHGLYRAIQQLDFWSIGDAHEIYHANLPITAHNRHRLLAMPAIQGRALADRLRAPRG